MSQLLSFYAVLSFGLTLAFVMLWLRRRDEAHPRKLARVRVPIDERRKQPMPPDEELESSSRPDWLIASAALLLMIIVVEALR